MVIELRVMQFWSEIILVISNRTRAVRLFDFEITRMISDQIALPQFNHDYSYSDKTWVFDQSGRTQGPIYVINSDKTWVFDQSERTQSYLGYK